MVDDHVDAAAVGQVTDLAGEVGLLVVDGVVRAQFLGVVEFLLTAGGGEHLRAGVVGYLDGRVTHAAGRAEDQH